MSRVVVARLPGGESKKNLDRDQYRTLLENGLKSLAAASETRQAVKKYIPGGVVGIKVNCLARKFNSTPVALAEALGDILADCDIDENNIIVWDRTNQELQWGGFKLNASSFGRRCLGTDTNGIGYSRDLFSFGDVGALVSTILTDLVNCNINLPVLKDHSIAGLSGGLKNMYGAINNPNKCHSDGCNPYAAHVSNLEPLRKKNRLSILDAVRVQFNGGPGFDSRYLSYYNGIVISDDPVAADRIGLEIIENLRKANNLPTLEKAGRPVKYLKCAEDIGLGIADLNKIDLQVVAVNGNNLARLGGLF